MPKPKSVACSKRWPSSLAACVAQPVLIALEDLHWSDETSLEFFQFFARRLEKIGILLVATYRGDYASPRLAQLLAQLNRERLAAELSLAPLAREQVEQMVRAIFQLDRPLEREFLDMLHSLTEGNPLTSKKS